MLFVRGFTEDSAARDAGIALDDRIHAVDGRPVDGWWDLVSLVGAVAPPPQENVASGCNEEPPAAQARSLTLEVVREGRLVEVAFTPRMRREVVRTLIYWRPLMGVIQDPNAYVRGALVQKRYTPARAATRATEEVGDVFAGTLTVLGQMFTGQRKMKETIGGPVAIFTMAGESAQRSWFEFVRLMGGISIGLGIVNLLPVPVLDGGHIVFYAIEGLRGRPLSLRLRERIQMIGVLFLVALVLVVTFNDLTGVLGG
jgi:regulator of sigma E protease